MFDFLFGVVVGIFARLFLLFTTSSTLVFSAKDMTLTLEELAGRLGKEVNDLIENQNTDERFDALQQACDKMNASKIALYAEKSKDERLQDKDLIERLTKEFKENQEKTRKILEEFKKKKEQAKNKSRDFSVQSDLPEAGTIGGVIPPSSTKPMKRTIGVTDDAETIDSPG